MKLEILNSAGAFFQEFPIFRRATHFQDK